MARNWRELLRQGLLLGRRTATLRSRGGGTTFVPTLTTRQQNLANSIGLGNAPSAGGNIGGGGGMLLNYGQPGMSVGGYFSMPPIGPLSDFYNINLPSQIRIVAPTGGDYTDPRAAIQACSAGDVVWIMAGTYPLTSTIVIPADGITVMGVGRDQVILNNTTESSQTVFALSGYDGICLRDFTIQTAVGNSGYGILGSGADDLRLLNLKVNSAALGIAVRLYPTDCPRVLIQGCLFTGVFTTAVLQLVSTRGIVTGNVIEQAGAGLVLDGRSNALLFMGNQIYINYGGYNQPALRLWSCNRTRIIANVISHGAAPGAWDAVCAYGATGATWRYNTVQGNVFVSQGNVGLGCRLATISGCYLDESIVDGNLFVAFATGIHVIDARVRETLLHGNKVATCTTPVINAGTNTNEQDSD